MKGWLESHPGKTERDWLLEVRCRSNEDKKALSELLENCEYAGIKCSSVKVNLSDELEEFCNSCPDETNSEKFKELFSEVLKGPDAALKKFDLYFPSKHWIVNIGSEIEDAYAQKYEELFWKEELNHEIVANACFPEYHSYKEGFLKYLNGKYQFPQYGESSRAKSNLVYLPWNYDLEAKNKLKSDDGYPFDMGSVASFMMRLFGTDFEKVSERSKERYLKSHPDLQDKRATFLDAKVTARLNESKSKRITDYEVKRLLKIVDSELYALYPEYKKSALL